MKTYLLHATLFILCAGFPALQAQEDEFHVFTNTKGQKLEARIVAVQGGQVRIERRDGQAFNVAPGLFIPADQAYIAAWKPPASPAPAPAAAPEASSAITAEQVNEVLGQPVFSDARLWDDAPEEAAERLKWPRESMTEFVNSYRKYPRADDRFLGARPFSAALYGTNTGVSSLSLVFANKGDSFGKLDGGDDPEEALNDAMEGDVDTISEALGAILGEGEKQRFGEGSGRQNVIRWNWNDHAFLLFEQEGEYVSLELQPKAFADGGGRQERVKDLEIRNRARGNVEERPNGDVVVRNIPMVDQGPKGYCAPATFERAMRYLGIPADMYLLAMAGETSMGGGTSIQSLVEGVGRDIKRKGRGFDSFQMKEFKMRELARYIDDGIPVMWLMYSTKAFNDSSNARTKARLEVQDWAAYAQQVEDESKELSLAVDRNTAHITLIVGYNKNTNEIAFSDSWGERYLERWVTAKEAEDISQDWFYVVTF